MEPKAVIFGSCFVQRDCLSVLHCSCFVLKKKREMANHNIVVDAWIREAEEGLRLVEDLENRIKNNRNPEQFSLRSTAGSKLLELGVKLDRLESLLHNPHSKPILYVFSSLNSSFGSSHGLLWLCFCLDPSVSLVLVKICSWKCL